MRKHFKDNYPCTIHDDPVEVKPIDNDYGSEVFFSKSLMDEMVEEIAGNIMKERDKFLIDQIENFVGKFEHEWELHSFISEHCRIERHPHNRVKLFVKNFPVIEWREEIVNEFDFETGTATTKLIWNQ